MSFAPDHQFTHTADGVVRTLDCPWPSCRLRPSREATLSALGCALQGVGMVATGSFLLSLVSTAPQLTLQVVLLGGLLVVVGLVFAASAVATLTSHLTVDRQGIRGRLGYAAFDVAWPAITRWRVSDHDDALSALACAEVWAGEGAASRSLPGGLLDREARRRLRESCRAFAPERERI